MQKLRRNQQKGDQKNGRTFMNIKSKNQAETRDLKIMEEQTESVYLTTAIISRRADQIAEKQKEELLI